MPTHKAMKNGKPGYQWGNQKIYTYKKGDKASERAAKRKAETQGRVIRKSGYKG